MKEDPTVAERFKQEVEFSEYQNTATERKVDSIAKKYESYLEKVREKELEPSEHHLNESTYPDDDETHYITDEFSDPETDMLYRKIR